MKIDKLISDSLDSLNYSLGTKRKGYQLLPRGFEYNQGPDESKNKLYSSILGKYIDPKTGQVIEGDV